MKTLIVSYSFSGNNELLAKYLQGRLGADMFRITEIKKRTRFMIFLDMLFNRTPEIKEFYHARDLYASYILIGPVWAGRIASPLKAFLANENERIGKYSFISVCGGAPNQKEKITRSLLAIVGHKPEVVEELSINEMLGSRGISESSTPYRLKTDDLEFFTQDLDAFVGRHSRKSVLQNEPAFRR